VNGVDVRLEEILLQTAQELRSEIIELEGVSDHVHLLCEVDPQLGINRLVGTLERPQFAFAAPGIPTPEAAAFSMDQLVFHRHGGWRTASGDQTVY
jgi:REP element-mobilizing transposase RayT